MIFTSEGTVATTSQACPLSNETANIMPSTSESSDTFSLAKEKQRLAALGKLLEQQKLYLLDLRKGMGELAPFTPDGASRFDPADSSRFTPEQQRTIAALERELAEITALLAPAPVIRPQRSRRQMV